MLRKLRLKFICINMAIVTAMLCVIFSFVLNTTARNLENQSIVVLKQIADNPVVAVCGDWFTGHGMGENLGWIRDNKNTELAEKLRSAFASWYDNGHTNEEDVNTVILRIRMTDGILLHHGTKYDIDFT